MDQEIKKVKESNSEDKVKTLISAELKDKVTETNTAQPVEEIIELIHQEVDKISKHDTVTDVLKEINERKNRENNIVIKGLKESGSTDAT